MDISTVKRFSHGDHALFFDVENLAVVRGDTGALERLHEFLTRPDDPPDDERAQSSEAIASALIQVCPFALDRTVEPAVSHLNVGTTYRCNWSTPTVTTTSRRRTRKGARLMAGRASRSCVDEREACPTYWAWQARGGECYQRAHTAALGGTFTLPLHRRRGLSESLTRFVCSEVATEGRRGHLIVDDDNAAAIALYLKTGFCPMGTCYMGYVSDGGHRSSGGER